MSTRPIYIDRGTNDPFDPLRHDGEIVSIDDHTVLAHTRRINPLRTPLEPDAPHIVTWSGSLADELFGAHPHTWMSPGREALRTWVMNTAMTLGDETRITLQPHARHVLSDVQTAFDFAREHPGGPFSVAMSPATMLVPSMLDQLEDHLTRYFETLGGCCSVVFLWDFIIADDLLIPAPLGTGRLPRETTLRLLTDNVPVETPIALWPGDESTQIDWLQADP